MEDVRIRMYKILKEQQDALCSTMERSGADTDAVEVARYDIRKYVNIVDSDTVDYLHLLIHLLMSAKDGGITELINVPEAVIPLVAIRNALLEVGMGPIEIDTRNRTYKHCLNRPDNWIVISYTQQKQVDTIELAHSTDCMCSQTIDAPDIPMQHNIYKELDAVSSCMPLRVWWDKLVGRLSIECNRVWPALANLHYISQPVVSIVPVVQENYLGIPGLHAIEKDIQQMSLYNRCWPRVERACGYASEGVHTALESSLILCEQIFRAGLLLAIIQIHIRTGEDNIDKEITGFSNTPQYIRHSSVLKPLFNIATGANPDAGLVESLTTACTLVLFQRIQQQFENAASQLNNVHVFEPENGYDKNKLVQMVEKQARVLCCLGTPTEQGILEEAATSVLVYIKNDPLKELRKNYPTGPRVVDTWAIRSLSHVAISSSAAWAEAYNDGDKLVAAIVFSNIREAIRCANTWATTDAGRDNVHPFKPLIHMSRPIWNTTKYSGPCGVIEIGCCRCGGFGNDGLSWPGWWMSMCPRGTATKAMTILGCAEKEIESWYIEQQRIALKSLAGIGSLRVAYCDCDGIDVVDEYDVIIMSNVNVMTITEGLSVHSNSHDIMAVVLEHTRDVACGMVMLRAAQPVVGTVEIDCPNNCTDSMGTLCVAEVEYGIGFLRGPCEHLSVREAKLVARFGKIDNLECNTRLTRIIRGEAVIM